jgi:hypothetical protein
MLHRGFLWAGSVAAALSVAVASADAQSRGNSRTDRVAIAYIEKKTRASAALRASQAEPASGAHPHRYGAD